MTIILYAIPAFFVLIGIELLLEKIKGTDYYRVNDAINSLSMGVLSRMVALMKQLVPLTFYVLAFEHLALFDWPDVWWTWLAAFVIYDFFYYWNHRMGHEMSLLWAAHVVHHSSEEYNLTTALRQTSGSVFSWIFYLPLAVLGFEPALFIAVGALNLVYQFWVHTRHVPKLGWFEAVFVTPSNHRVHHAQNQIYLDRNYGGVFILWDRWFGTFQEELDDQQPIYGVRKALHSWNPLWGNVQVYTQLCKDSWRTQRWSDKFRVWFGRTGWRPDDVAKAYPLPRVDLNTFTKYDTPMSLTGKAYAVVQYVLMTVIALAFMLNVSAISTVSQIGLAVFVALFSVSLGWMMEGRRWAWWTEGVKNIMILAMPWWLGLPDPLLWALSGLSGGSLLLALLAGKQRNADIQAQTMQSAELNH
ncbi:sterol desaturase family protein [Aestuariibacter halophilus]|uniref:Sterol desaturase family protein n=1 Tax=Fluctibacter halophilus TaxID=226011 RepID=A0ABS8G8R2_9ALTE|nr:sterol desaturase family protein [Aestuariibacter halophilus]MCC2616967.1 sterol desaturase family protein [Aestuariibacter halophilus]